MGLTLTFAQEYLKAFSGYLSTFRMKPCYLGLSTTIPNQNGTNFTEPNVNSGYKRLPLTDELGNTVFGNVTVSNGEASVTNLQSVVRSIASASWGTIRYVGLFNQETDGELLVFAPLTVSIVINTDQLPVLGVGELSITIGCQNGRVHDSALPSYMSYFTGVGSTASLASACYLGLSLTTPTDSGANFTEPDRGYGYTRVLIGGGSENSYHAIGLAESIGNGTYYIYNNKQIAFPAPTLNWGTLTHFGLFTAPTGGAPVLWGALKTEVEILRGYIPIFKYGAFSITLS